MVKPPIFYWFAGTLEIPAQYMSRFSGCQNITRGRGPEPDRMGLMATPFRCDAIFYDADSQRWDQIADDVWIGCQKGVSPDQLRRDRPRPGYKVRLGDGNEWLIPVANPFVSTCGLPRWDIKVKDGWVSQIQDAFESVSTRAAEVAAKMRADALKSGSAEFDSDHLRQLLADALSINYDLTIDEMSVLRLFSPDTMTAAIQAIVDWAEIERTLINEVARLRGLEGPGVDPFGG